MEPTVGRVPFIGLYLASLAAGSMGALLISKNAFTVGASGAVFGLLGAVAVGVRQRGASVWHSGIGPLLVVNLVITFAVPGISIGGHVGGLVGGALVGGPLLAWRPSRYAAVAKTVFALACAVAAVAGAVWASGLP
jgi:membrane associated rhomboid family serine protease